MTDKYFMRKIEISTSATIFNNITELSTEDKMLMNKAIEARGNAYAPYSKFNVGAALLLDNGEVVIGSNQENAAYPSGLCAERVAIYQAEALYPDANIEKIVYTSSIAAIGTDGKGTPSTEKTPFASWHFASEYIMSKYISHLEVKGMVKDGLPATMVMPALPFGPGDRMPTPTGTMIIGALKGKMKNYWDGGVCPVDVRDVAAGHILAMDNGRVGESYILGNSSNNMTNQEFLQLVGRIAGVDNVATKEVSRAMMLRVAKFAEVLSKITGKAPVTTVKNSAYVMEHFYVDASKAVEELGLPQTPIETAIQDSVDWFRANGYV